MHCPHALRGHAYRVAWLSEVCRLAGRGEEAWQRVRQALDLARQRKARGNEAHALHQLGVVHAHTALATASDLYRAMDMTFWLPHAEAVLAQVA